MKVENFIIKQQLDTEKMALHKIRRYRDQLLTGISTLVAFALSDILAFVFAQLFKDPAAYEHPEDVFQNSGPVYIAKAAYENPGGFLNVTYHNITAGTEKLGETALQAVQSPTQTTTAAAQVTMIILFFMTCRHIWRTSTCFRCRACGFGRHSEKWRHYLLTDRCIRGSGQTDRLQRRKRSISLVLNVGPQQLRKIEAAHTSHRIQCQGYRRHVEDTEAYEHPEDVVQNTPDISGQATVTAQIIILLVWRAGSSGAARHASAAACGLGRDLEKWRHYSLIDRCKQHMAVVSIAASRIRMVTRVETMTRRISRATTREGDDERAGDNKEDKQCDGQQDK